MNASDHTTVFGYIGDEEARIGLEGDFAAMLTFMHPSQVSRHDAELVRRAAGARAGAAGARAGAGARARAGAGALRLPGR